MNGSMKILRHCLVIPIATLLLFFSTACSLFPVSGGSTPRNYGSNLLANPGAENGPGDSGGETPVSQIPGWTRNGDIDVLPYGAHGIVSLSDPGPSNRGQKLFTGGPDTPNTSASQTIDLSSQIAGKSIENDEISYTLSGYLGGYGSQGDNATLLVQFEDHAGKILGTAQIGPVSVTDRRNQTELLQRTTTGKVPKGTVKLVVTLRMIRTFGTDNDGYADNLSLILQKS